MEKRRHQRTPISLGAILKVEDYSYKGFLANLSESGVGAYFETSSPEIKSCYSPGSDIIIEFQTSSGKTIELTCIVKWLHIHENHEQLNSLGIEIIDPPQSYKEYHMSLTEPYCPA